VAIHTAIVAWACWVQSPNANEAAHVISGISHWEFGRFELYRGNPPLVRMVATIPAVLMGCKVDWSLFSEAPGSRSEGNMVPQYIEANGEWSYWYVILGRLMCLPFTWLGAWSCFWWADELYGRRSALLATALWCFSPNEIALASFMTPDGPASCAGVAAGYLFWRWLERPTYERAALAGALLGLALLTKLTWVTLLALWPMITLINLVRHRKNTQMPGTWQQVLQFLVMISVALHVLNSCYLYGGTFKKLGEHKFICRALTGQDRKDLEKGWGNRFQGTFWGEIPLPVPEQFVLGFDIQKGDFDMHRRTYLRGKMYETGLWYYYLYGLAIKTPVGVFLIGAVAMLNRKGLPAWTRMAWILPAHFAFFMAVISAELSWNSHLRYALPALPFFLIWTSRAALVLGTGQKLLSSLLVFGSVWFLGSSLRYVPESVSYFNEIAGGPENGHFHLIDSNVDWGQDLFRLKHWLDAHPEVGKIGLIYHGHFNARAMGIDFFLPEDDSTVEREPGWYAVSVTMLHGNPFWQTYPDGRQFWCKRDGFIDFLKRQPVDRAGYSILIYHIE
jgi:hypothetical protein